MNSQPLISVIIPAYNAEDTIREAVESALSQTYHPLEILVIDDGSTDQTTEKLSELDARLRVFKQSNAGPSAARNHGLREASGTWIAFLDADDRWLPEKLAQQWEYLTHHDEIGFIHTDVTFFDPATNRQWQTDVGRENFVGRCTEQLLLENRVLTSSVLVKREFLEETGHFDEQFIVAEDYDLWLRLSSVCAFAYLASPLVQYRVQAGSLSTHSLSMRKSELDVLRKALLALAKTTDTQARFALSSSQLQARLRQLNWDIGSQAFEQEDYTQARPYLGQTLRLDPWNVRAAYLWLFTWLPKGIVSGLRRWKQRSSPLANSLTS